MNESAISQARELLETSETVGIAVGKNPTVDEMGAALALYLSLQVSGKRVSVSSATEPLVEHSNLVGIDRVKSRFEGEGGDLIVSFPYKEGEIDKVSYTLDEGALNIVVKPGELGLSFTEEDVIFKRKGEYPQLIFTIGVSRISDLSAVFDLNTVKDSRIINIDNKEDNQGFGDITMISPQSSSVSEQVARFLLSLGYEMDLDVSQNLLSGIFSATNNFQNPKTTPIAFEVAGVLMQKGAVRPSSSRQETSPDQGQVLQQISKRYEQRHHSADSEQGQTRFDPSSARRGRHERRGRHDSGQRDFNQRNPNPPAGGQNKQGQKPPEDWLIPKVYKGSTSV